MLLLVFIGQGLLDRAVRVLAVLSSSGTVQVGIVSGVVGAVERRGVVRTLVVGAFVFD